jgi:hypothetical protein
MPGAPGATCEPLLDGLASYLLLSLPGSSGPMPRAVTGYAVCAGYCVA